MSGTPQWLKVVDAVDKAVTPRVEGLVQHESFGLVLAIVTRARRGVNARAERLSRRLLHTVNLPAGSDVNRLLAQIALVEREIRELSKSVAELPHADGGGSRAAIEAKPGV